MNEIAGVLNWVQDLIGGLLQWLPDDASRAPRRHGRGGVASRCQEQPVEGGLTIEISGAGRTLAAIRRLVQAQAQELDRSPGWETKVESRADGVMLTVTSTDPRQVAHIRGLGFIGLLASGPQHEFRHLAISWAG